MPWSAGTFSRTDGTRNGSTVWTQAKAAAVKIIAADHDTHDQDLATGINAALNKNGENSPTTNINWGGFKITNLAAGTTAGDALRYEQIGAQIQAYSAMLAAIAALTPTDSNFIVGNGSTWVAESGATVRTSLGLTIGTNVQAYDALLASIAGLTFGANNYIYGTGSDTAAVGTINADQRTWAALADPTATASQEGIVELATSAEALAGSDSARAVTSAGLAGDQTKASTGHTVLPGGIIINWGTVSVNTNATASKNYSKAFTTVYMFMASKSGTPADDERDCFAESSTTSAITIKNESGSTVTAMFFAIGV